MVKLKTSRRPKISISKRRKFHRRRSESTVVLQDDAKITTLAKIVNAAYKASLDILLSLKGEDSCGVQLETN